MYGASCRAAIIETFIRVGYFLNSARSIEGPV